MEYEMKCILCGLNPPIKNSHVVPKFVLKRLKERNPLRILKYSDRPQKTYQDGWKKGYLCSQCEQKLSSWETYFCSNIYDPFIDCEKEEFILNDTIALFSASLHFRYIKYVFDVNTAKDLSEVLPLFYKLKAICLNDSYKDQGLYQYINLLHPVTELGLYPPGINTYFFESIDGAVFDWIFPKIGKKWMNFVKIPHVLFILSEIDLGDALNQSESFSKNIIPNTGKLSSKANNEDLLLFVAQRMKEKAIEIQSNYSKISENQMNKIIEKINSDPNKESTRAYRSYMLDAKLLKKFSENA